MHLCFSPNCILKEQAEDQQQFTRNFLPTTFVEKKKITICLPVSLDWLQPLIWGAVSKEQGLAAGVPSPLLQAAYGDWVRTKFTDKRMFPNGVTKALARGGNSRVHLTRGAEALAHKSLTVTYYFIRVQSQPPKHLLDRFHLVSYLFVRRNYTYL